MYVPKNYIKVVYFSYFHSILSYGLLLLRGNSTHINKVSTLAHIVTRVAGRIKLSWLFHDAVSTTTLFNVDEIGDSEMVFGEMRPRIRHRLPGIHLTVGENLGKTQPADEPREFNLPTLPQRRSTYVLQKFPSKYGVHSEENLPIRTERNVANIRVPEADYWYVNNSNVSYISSFHTCTASLLLLSFIVVPTCTYDVQFRERLNSD
ncbi:hypothetical protein ANN_11228 [Periplaneta americana]|uniref:Uncharacterized protein n=1 Tax=Periplaneta americana TaxID=6978 RepID=A0ABQ8T4E8_PERAM|nr:hypothetical protein ANN_11228 [Periplaneta americana]